MTKNVNNPGLSLLPDPDLGALSAMGDEPVQSALQPTPRSFRRAAREVHKAALKKELLRDILPAPVAQGEFVHVVSNGRFDYATFIPLILDWIGKADVMYGSTWTMSRANVVDLFRFYDEGKIGQLTVCSGNYFLKRESAVAATLIEGLKARGQRFRCWENHTKVILMSNEARGDFYVVEGSANWTANPRTEQSCIGNHRPTFEFHRAWIEEVLKG